MKRIVVQILLSILALDCGFAEVEDSRDIVHTPDHQHYSRSAYEAGRRDAERDLREGKLIFEMYGGPPPPWNGDWVKMLREKYHIELKEVAGCVVDYRIVGHALGYNELSGAEIDRRFGTDFIRTSRAEVQKQFEERHK